jgi:hypothetical protein
LCEVAFLDEEEAVPAAQTPQRPRRREPRGQRQQQILLRRLIAVGVGFAVLLLFVLGIRSCLDARKERGISNYVRDLDSLMAESEQVGKDFFGLLDSPGDLSDLQVQSEIRSYRGAAEALLNRSENLNTPGDMSSGQDAVEESLQLRRDALQTIADNVTGALGRENRVSAIDTIEQQMKALLASDVLYEQVAKGEINSVLEEEGIDAELASSGRFMPEPPADVEWLNEDRITEFLAQVGGGEAATQGIQGLGLVDTTLGATTLSTDSPTAVSIGETELEVQVQNQGESEATDVQVTVSVGGETAEAPPIASIPPGETASATVDLPTPPEAGAEVTIDVEVQPLPGEQVADNNSASYEVTFE